MASLWLRGGSEGGDGCAQPRMTGGRRLNHRLDITPARPVLPFWLASGTNRTTWQGQDEVREGARAGVGWEMWLRVWGSRVNRAKDQVGPEVTGSGLVQGSG